MSGTARSRLGLCSSGNINHGVLNSAGNSSGPSMDASSLVTEANSSFSGGGRQLPSSSSINDECYMHLPASPLSCSNNISGSSVIDNSPILQLSPQKELIPKQGNSTFASQSTIQDVGMFPAQKRPRLDFRQADVHQQQIIQQWLQRHRDLQVQAFGQPSRLSQIQQHQLMQSLPQLQRIQMQQPSHAPRPSISQMISTARPPVESGLCARRLLQYMYHQSHRPADNSLLYWRKFVVEYFSPRAKKRWCFALHNSAGNHAFGAFPQASMDAWQCGVCGSKSGKGYEATYEVLPRLDQIKFDHGLIDELLYLDMPNETRLQSGLMVLDYAKAIQESVHEHCRVAREGRLRITFTPDLKILCWEFCARRHEEFVPRSMIVHQVNQLLHAAHKYKTSLGESGSSEASVQDLQDSCNMFSVAGRQMARNVELPLLNDLGFSKRYVRCLQISEVINCMKDLIGFSQLHKVGPIESLKSYSQQAAVKFQSQKMKMDQTLPNQNLPADQNALNKLMAIHPGLGTHAGNMYTPTFFPTNSPQGAGPSNNYHHMLRSSPNPGQSPSFPAGQMLHHAQTKNPQQLDFQASQHFQHQATRQHPHEMMHGGAARQQPNIPPSAGDSGRAASGDQNGSGISTIEVPREIKIAGKSAEAPKMAAERNSVSPSGCRAEAGEVVEELNLGDLDQELFEGLIDFDGIKW